MKFELHQDHSLIFNNYPSQKNYTSLKTFFHHKKSHSSLSSNNFANSSIILPAVTNLTATFAKLSSTTKFRSGPHTGKVSPGIADSLYPPVRTSDQKIAKLKFSFYLVVISENKFLFQAPK